MLNLVETKLKILSPALFFIVLLPGNVFSDENSGFGSLDYYWLNQKTVNAIIQDSTGYLWFGTEYGLYKYDGYNLKRYLFEPGDTTSIGSSYIRTLFKDNDGQLWIGTWGGGLNKYNYLHDNFERYTQRSDAEFGEDHINSICEDDNGNLWYIVRLNGLVRLNKNTGERAYYEYDPASDQGIIYNDLDELLIDHQNNLWIGAWFKGLCRLDLNDSTSYNPGKANFRYFFNTRNTSSIPEDATSIVTMMEDSRKTLWIGTHRGGDGLAYYNMHEDTFIFVDKFKNTRVLSLSENKPGELWLGTDEGIMIYNILNGEVISYSRNLNDPGSINNDRILCIYKDNYNVTWIGSENGINYLINKKFMHYRPGLSRHTNNMVAFEWSSEDQLLVSEWDKGVYVYQFDDKREVDKLSCKDQILFNNDFKIWTILNENKRFLWFGTFENGIIRYDKEKKATRQILLSPEKSRDNQVPDIVPFGDQHLLVATWNGLYLLNTKTFEKKHFYHRADVPGSISSNTLTSIFIDSRNFVWIGTRDGGVNRISSAELLNGIHNFYSSKNEPENNHSISYNYINTIIEDSKHNIWIGTEGGGMNKTKLPGGISDSLIFKRVSYNNGLPSDYIRSIIEVDSFLWLSTSNGLCRYQPGLGRIETFTTKEGLQHMQFNSRSALKMPNKTLCFGGINGFNVFHPDSIQSYYSNDPVFITDLYILNEKVEIGEKTKDGRVILNKSLLSTKEIKLSYKDKMISFEFIALNFANPEQTKYEYILEGFDEEWHLTNAAQRKVTYTNLNPGEYVFKVKSGNVTPGQSKNTAMIRLFIKPPWWQTMWALFLYLSVIFGILMLFRRYSVIKEKLKNDVLKERLEKEKICEVDDIKSRFFMNISHEVRTPLSLIISPLEKLMEDSTISRKIAFQYEIMYCNAKRLLNLINQYMDFRQLELGEVHVKTQKIDIIDFAKDIYNSFYLQAKDRRITYHFISDKNVLEIWFDPEKLEKVIANLLSNAFKFTLNGGKITLKISTKEVLKEKTLLGLSQKTEEYAIITVSDNGRGIPIDKKGKIFDRFFRIENNDEKQFPGVGIGLSMVKELVELHKGMIDVESEPEKGSNFSIYLPTGKDHLQNHEMDSMQYIKRAMHQEYQEYHHDNETIYEIEDYVVDEKLPLVMVVEDNAELRNFIREELRDEYNIMEARDGAEAFEKASRFIPNLIISDIMMPEVDGIMLCKKIKNDLRTSHIPVILLTAKSSEETNIDGFAFGADAYIIKPFSMKVLKARIKNLIEAREKMKEKFEPSVKFDSKEIVNNRTDKAFLENAIKIVNQHMDDVDFDSKIFAREIGVSRSLLYIKIKAITNKSVSDFIKTIRLKKASRLLLERKYSVGEIIYMVGFNNRSYFTRCFRKQFGMNPTEYVNENFQN